MRGRRHRDPAVGAACRDRARHRAGAINSPDPSAVPSDRYRRGDGRLFGAFRAYLEGTFTDRVFVVSFISNVLIAAAIVYVGDQIGVGSQLATAVVVVLGIRIFTNAAAIRRALIHA
jgi:Protein of unknown function (DUF1290)